MELAASNPQKRLVQPWEVAETEAWPLPSSASITGQAISVAGGEVMKADEVNFERKDYETGVQNRMKWSCILTRLLTCINLLDTEVRTRLKQTAGTTLPRFDMLAQLERHGPMSMGS